MKITQTVFLRIIGWLHALVLFWGFYPLAALTLKLDTDTSVSCCLTGVLLLFPIIISWYAAAKIKHLPVYLFAGMLVSFGYSKLIDTIDICPEALASLSFLLSILIFLIRGYVRIRKGKLKKILLDLPSPDPERIDYRKLEVPVFLDVPHPVHWWFLAVQYVLGALLKSSVYWNMIFYLLLSDVFLCFVYQFIEGFYQFLREHSRSANLPVKTMQKVVRIIFGIACIILILFTFPSLLYRKAPLSELTFEQYDTSLNMEDSPAYGPEITDMESALPAAEAAPSPPEWLKYVSALILCLLCIGTAFAMLAVIYFSCKRAGKFFASDTEDSIQFLEKDFSEQALPFNKKKRAAAKNFSANMQIRKYYKRTIQKALNTPPSGSETPAELETAAGFTKSENQQLLHAYYEKARYSNEVCTPKEASIVKKLPD